MLQTNFNWITLYNGNLVLLFVFIQKYPHFFDNLIMKNTHISKIVLSIHLAYLYIETDHFIGMSFLKFQSSYIFNFALYDENRKVLVEEEKQVLVSIYGYV